MVKTRTADCNVVDLVLLSEAVDQAPTTYCIGTQSGPPFGCCTCKVGRRTVKGDHEHPSAPQPTGHPDANDRAGARTEGIGVQGRAGGHYGNQGEREQPFRRTNCRLRWYAFFLANARHGGQMRAPASRH